MDTNALNHQIEDLARECEGEVSVAVRNIENAADIESNAKMVISAASVIKVPILIEALRQVKDGKLGLESEFVLTEEFCTPGAGIVRYLHEGMALTLNDLLILMIIVSDNAATNQIIDVLGMDSVNRTMSSMGYQNTRLQRKMMDWSAIEYGRDNLTSADEMTDLLARTAKNECLGAEWDAKILETLARQQDTRKLGLFLPDEAHLANKTGARDGIENDCGIVAGPGFRYSIAVFTCGAKSPGDAVVGIGRISRAVYDWIKMGD